ncbi:MAG: hypothetical protein JRH11_18905 [Deltaproteobacteria bacterium]|nr:hypothetical protein [Deltaproteobacteria bacterium]
MPDQNGAGIRQQGTNLTVRGCYFHDNEDGILAGDDSNSEILVEYSRFENNGYGDGQSHNFYINHVKRFTLRFSYSHRAVAGHLAKSRATENHILYNRLSTEDGTSSYELDLSNGGLSYVIGNVIVQSDSSPNGGMLAYQLEGAHPDNPSHELFVVNNTFVNDRVNGGTFVNVGGSVATPVVLRNNIFMGAGTVTSQANAVLEGNFEGDPMFVDKVGYDFELMAASPAVDAGVEPGMGAGMSLEPSSHYVHPTAGEGRVRVGGIDAGAFELGGGVVGGGGTGGGSTGGGAGTGASAAGGGAVGTGGGGVGGGAGTGANGGSSLEDGEDDGCGCRVPGRAGRGAGGGALAIGLMLGGLWARRRMRRRGGVG